MEICKNCEATLQGPYCSQSGQKALAERITLRYITWSFIEALTNVEQGFWYTMRSLLTKPGIVAREYLEGKRKPYFHPVRYLLILVTAATLIALATGVYDLQQNEILHFQNDFFPGVIIYALPASILVSSAYYGVGYRQLFSIGYGKAFTRGLLANVLGFLLMFVSTIIMTALGVLIFVAIFK